MNLKKISAEIPQEQETQVLQYVKDIESHLPFLVDLNSKERIRLAKLSRGRVDMVDCSFIHSCHFNPGISPISCHFKKKTSSENNTDNPDNTENTDSIDTDRTGNCTPEPPVETN